MTNEFTEFMREEVRAAVNAHCRKTGQPHSLVWRMAYLKLEGRTGYRVPDTAKSMLKAVEAAGFIEDLYDVIQNLN